MDYAEMPSDYSSGIVKIRECPLRAFQVKIDLMLASSSVIPLGLLNMQPFRYCLKAHVD